MSELHASLRTRCCYWPRNGLEAAKDTVKLMRLHYLHTCTRSFHDCIFNQASVSSDRITHARLCASVYVRTNNSQAESQANPLRRTPTDPTCKSHVQLYSCTTLVLVYDSNSAYGDFTRGARASAWSASQVAASSFLVRSVVMVLWVRATFAALPWLWETILASSQSLRK